MKEVVSILDTRHLAIPLPEEHGGAVTIAGKVTMEHMASLSRLFASQTTAFNNLSQWTRSASYHLFTRVMEGVQGGEFSPAVARHRRFLLDMEALGNALDFERHTALTERAVLRLWKCGNYDGAAGQLARSIEEAEAYDPFFGTQVRNWAEANDAFKEIRKHGKKKR